MLGLREATGVAGGVAMTGEQLYDGAPFCQVCGSRYAFVTSEGGAMCTRQECIDFVRARLRREGPIESTGFKYPPADLRTADAQPGPGHESNACASCGAREPKPGREHMLDGNDVTRVLCSASGELLNHPKLRRERANPEEPK